MKKFTKRGHFCKEENREFEFSDIFRKLFEASRRVAIDYGDQYIIFSVSKWPQCAAPRTRKVSVQMYAYIHRMWQPRSDCVRGDILEYHRNC